MSFYRYSIGTMFVICNVLSFFSTMENWNKTFDNQLASIWMENEGWKDTTYLYGACVQYGFEYYITHSEGYEEGQLDNAAMSVDNKNLPLRFWAWRVNWDGDGWQATIDAAKNLGYTVTIYKDAGRLGQLAYCDYEEKIDDFEAKDVVLSVLDATYEDGLLHIKLGFRNQEEEAVEYNSNDYEISYHILDSKGNPIQWDNDRVQINKWINYSTQEIVIDTSKIEKEDYTIQFDIVQEGAGWLSDIGADCPSIVFRNGQLVK